MKIQSENTKVSNKNTKKSTTKQIKKEDKKQKTKKGKSMYANGLYSTTGTNTTAAHADLLPPEEVVNISLSNSQKNRGYIFIDHKNIQEIYEKSGPLAKDNEFQVHYWFLNFRYTAEDGSNIDIAVPTCYFNYEQFVTTGHIDFELTDMIPVSEAIEPLHNVKANQIMKTDLNAKINEIFGVAFEPMSVNFGTLHRHPGTSAHQSFSSTDLNINVKTKKDSLGVVFPLATAEDNKPSFSLIIAIDGQTNHYYSPSAGVANLAHAEYRVANGDIKTGLHYEKNRCIAFNIKERTKPSLVEKMFGAKEVSNTVVKFNNTENSLVEIEQSLGLLFEEFYNETYTASTDIVISDNIKKVVSTQKKETTKKQSFSYYYNEDEVNEMYNEFDKENKEKKDASNHYTKNMKVTEKEYVNAVNKLEDYEKNEKLNILIDAHNKKELIYPLNFESLKKCVDDYNLLSIAYYGTPENQLELVETYFTELNGNFTFDTKDIEDFAAEIQLTIENITTEQSEFRRIISMWKMINSSSTKENKESQHIEEIKEQISEDNIIYSEQLKNDAIEPENKSIFKKATEAVGTLFHKDIEQK